MNDEPGTSTGPGRPPLTPEEKLERKLRLAKIRQDAKARRAERHEAALAALPAVRPAPTHELTGLTRHNCPNACRADRCVISGDTVCVHPFKGGLHPKHLVLPPILRRFQEAKDKIDRDDLDRRLQRA